MAMMLFSASRFMKDWKDWFVPVPDIEEAEGSPVKRDGE